MNLRQGQELSEHAPNHCHMDDELQRIREKKFREMEEQLHQPKKDIGVQPITAANFKAMVAAHPFLVIDFWAEWCGPCRMVAPVIEELSHEFAGRVAFAKCNTDENPGIAGSFGISAIPTIVMIANGKVVDKLVGAYPKEPLRARISKVFLLA
jgi:thioredoxin 1